MPNSYHHQDRTTQIWTILIMLMAVIPLLSGCGIERVKVYRVGILCGADTLISIGDSFRQRMTELGYVEGKNIVYDVRKTNVDLVAERQVLGKFVADKVDLIFVFPTTASKSAKAATRGTNIPVVFTFTTIEGSDLVESVREPGGNITGVRFPGPGSGGQTLPVFDAVGATDLARPGLRGPSQRTLASKTGVEFDQKCC